jgi:hypothetical protein
MAIDPDLKPFLPVIAIVVGGFLVGLALLVIAILTGP